MRSTPAFDITIDDLGGARQVIRLANSATDELAIVFPGLSYAAERPLLHFAGAVFRARGRDVLNVVYPNLRAEAFEALPEDVQTERFRAFARAVALDAVDTRPYRRIAIVGKSLGTVAVVEIALCGAFDNLQRECVLLTPLASEARMAEAAASLPRTLVVLGDEDPRSVECRAVYDGLANVEVHSFPGGHSLEVEEDPIQSVTTLGEYVHVLTRWVDADLSPSN